MEMLTKTSSICFIYTFEIYLKKQNGNFSHSRYVYCNLNKDRTWVHLVSVSIFCSSQNQWLVIANILSRHSFGSC